MDCLSLQARRCSVLEDVAGDEHSTCWSQMLWLATILRPSFLLVMTWSYERVKEGHDKMRTWSPLTADMCMMPQEAFVLEASKLKWSFTTLL